LKVLAAFAENPGIPDTAERFVAEARVKPMPLGHLQR
jgi:hypothetical protein